MSEAAAPSTIELKSHYVRERHCMAVFGSFSPFYMDYYLHQMQLGRKPDPDHDLMLKELMSAVVLHLMSRPRDEITAWTVNLQAPSLNLLVNSLQHGGNRVGCTTCSGKYILFRQDVVVVDPINNIRNVTLRRRGKDDF